MAAQTYDRHYADIHNQDIDRVLALTAKRNVEAYYGGYSEKRIAEHLRLYRESCQAVKPENVFAVECLHVGTDADGITYSEEELVRAAKTLSFRPIDINHARKFNTGSHLPFPECQTLWMDYSPALQAVVGHIHLDNHYSWQVRLGKITAVSVEFFSLSGTEGCGMVFTGLSLVQNAKPADKKARILGDYSH